MSNKVVRPFPSKILHNVVAEYDPYWIEDYSLCAYQDVARDDDGWLLPYCLVVSVTPGAVVNLFTVVNPSMMMLTIAIFRTNEEMAKFVELHANSILVAMTDFGMDLINQDVV